MFQLQILELDFGVGYFKYIICLSYFFFLHKFEIRNMNQ